ncbi:MAG: hypothetical protein PHE49_01805 [bacterium]|nr:hypothetical protein [bacterium]
MKFNKNRLFSLLSALICLIISKILANPDFTTKYLSSDNHIEVNTLKMIQSLHILMLVASFLIIVTIFIPIHKIKNFFQKNVFLTIPLIFIICTVIVSVLFFCGSYGPLLLQSILYALLITAFFSLFLLKDKISYFNKILFIFLIGISLRVLTSLLFFGTYDVGAYIRFYNASELGKNIYLTTDYNYFPIWLWILKVVGWISKFFNIPFFIVVKYPTIMTDIFIFFIIFSYLKHQKINKDNIFLILSGFFLNPLSIMVSSYHNQFCNISILFLLLTCYLYSLNTNKKYVHGIFMGISITVKHFTLFCIPIIFFRYKKLW